MHKGATGLDFETIANHQRRVAEKLEDMALNGDANVVLNGTTVFGLRNHPNRNTFSHTFTLATATGAQWLTTMTAMLAQAASARKVRIMRKPSMPGMCRSRMIRS